MPKVRSEKSPAMDWSGSYPYPSGSENLELPRPRLGSAEDWKEWDDTRCSICMETPHNTVILKCSSYEMGCRPYMCNTSYRHSNCLDQFCKSFDSHLSSAKLEEFPLERTAPHDKKLRSEVVNPSQCENQLQPKLICPLCRGGVYGYMVSEPARRYMNCKQRTCSSETCEFQGTYKELRKHARREHPKVDISRQYGGVNFINLDPWNTVTMLKLLWNICRKVDSLWVKWDDMLAKKQFHMTSIYHELIKIDADVKQWRKLMYGNVARPRAIVTLWIACHQRVIALF